MASTVGRENALATELAQVSIGRSAVLHRSGPGGLPVRDVVPAKDRGKLAPWLEKTPDQIAWMQEKVGRYPFETYGLLVAEARTGFELETQTLSLFERELFTRSEIPKWYVESIMVHELAHQWFGDSVTPRTWSDLWLNEGHATWYEALYAQETADQSLEERMRARGQDSDEVIRRRLAAAREEMSHYDEFDYVIVNEHFATAVDEMCAIFTASRLRREAQAQRHAGLIATLLQA